MMRRLVWLLALALIGCSDSAQPRAQWVVVISTNARIPQMGDRVLVEVLGPSGDELACVGCRRLFGADAPSELPFELGVVPDAGGRQLRMRARLLRSSAIDAPASIDRIGLLTDADPDARVSLQLGMDCFGVPADPMAQESCDPASGESRAEAALPDVAGAPPLTSDAWPPLADTPCSEAGDDDSICIAGGAFLLGDADGVGSYDTSAPTVPERLVRVSPFFLDRTEYTLERYALLANEGLAPAGLPGTGLDCTFGSIADPSAGELPLNCVSPSLAAQICEAEGKRLPTEAEWELAASNRTLETRYPWGDDDDICAHAIVAHGDAIGSCLVTPSGTLPPGIRPSGQADDVTLLGVRDLGGNVAEWVTGTGAPYDAPCFDPETTLLVDPTCDDAAYLPVARGGHWRGVRSGARSTTRSVHLSGDASVGFRCARSDGASQNAP